MLDSFQKYLAQLLLVLSLLVLLLAMLEQHVHLGDQQGLRIFKLLERS